mgnify:CR=1 FL=1
MELIAHRRDSIADLRSTDTALGVEVDIRSNDGELIIHHDPFAEGERFEDWISEYQHGTLILNVKEEGLEPTLIDVMDRHQITEYFFLDQSFPFLLKWWEAAGGRSAVRVSEYESVGTALALAGKVNWVWIDCFTRFPLGRQDADRLTDSGLKLCIVSPELQGRDPVKEISALARQLDDLEITPDAVCTKRPDVWDSTAIRR